MASVSAGVTFRGSAGVGRGVEPSKNPQRRFACIASRKRTAKIAQFVPSGSRRGILAGSCSIAGVGAGGGGGAEVVDDPAGGAAGPITSYRLREPRRTGAVTREGEQGNKSH